MPGKKRSAKQKNKHKQRKSQTCTLDTSFEVYCDEVEAQLEDEHSQRQKEKKEKKEKADSAKNLLATTKKTSNTSVLAETAVSVGDQERECTFVTAAKKAHACAEGNEQPRKTNQVKTLKVKALADEERRLKKEILCAREELRSIKFEQEQMEASLQEVGLTDCRARLHNKRTALETAKLRDDYEKLKIFFQRDLRLHLQQKKILIENKKETARCNAEFAATEHRQMEAIARNNAQIIAKRDECTSLIARANAELVAKHAELVAKHELVAAANLQEAETIARIRQYYLIVDQQHFTPEEREKIRQEQLLLEAATSSMEQGEVKTATELTTPTKKKHELKNQVLLAAGLSPIRSPSASAMHALPPPAATCVICFEHPSTRLFVPCGHFCVCGPCALRYHDSGGRSSGCPMCRKKYTGVIKMYKQ